MVNEQLIPIAYFPKPHDGEDVAQQLISVELVDCSGVTVQRCTMTRSDFFARYPTKTSGQALL